MCVSMQKWGREVSGYTPKEMFTQLCALNCKLNPTEVADGQFEKGLVLPNLGKAQHPLQIWPK